jgi:hypothetical protein
MEPGKSSVRFFFFWILVNVAGWFTFDIFGYYLAIALIGIGLLLAWLQWLVLKHYFDVESTWIWLSFLPLGIHYALMVSSGQTKGSLILYTFLIFGLAGYLQWRVLSFYMRNAGLWIVASPLAGSAAMLLTVFVVGFVTAQNGSPYGIFQATFGLVYGVITGIAILIADKLPGTDTSDPA